MQQKQVLKNGTGFATSSFAQKTDLANLKSGVDKLDIDELKNVPSGLSGLNSKVGKLDVDKLVPVPLLLSKLNEVVKMILLKKMHIEDKIPVLLI